MPYRHTQPGYWPYFFFAFAAVAIALAWVTSAEFSTILVLCLVAFIFLTMVGLFSQMTVSDQGDHLLIEFGPLNWIHKRIAYSRIKHCEVDKTILIDGWGIHWVPGRGWTFNIWGFQCVKCRTERNVLRIGTDQPQQLAELIQSKIRE